MQTFPECYTCLVEQASTAMSINDISNPQQILVMREVLQLLSQADVNLPPSETADATNQLMREMTGITDFYREIKTQTTIHALEIYPYLQNLVNRAEDSIDMALRVCVAGNIIDVIHGNNFNLMEIVERVKDQPFSGNGMEDFRRDLASAEYLLIIADNAGETVFDRVLVETLDIPVIYAVKSGPILNDATMEDALAVDMDKFAKIIETGSDGPGTILYDCTPEFREIMANAPLILAKGQANFETLGGKPYKQLYQMLQTKCPIIARYLDIPVGNIVLKHA
jgi:uncharacterized protein with ATP-grasp and redox domains